jgi:hypothetical protein
VGGGARGDVASAFESLLFSIGFRDSVMDRHSQAVGVRLHQFLSGGSHSVESLRGQIVEFLG